MTREPRIVEHLVIGGGPAGSMAAIQLAEAGKRVTLIEKEGAAHHKVCGEFLSQEAVEYLQQVSIAPRELGASSIHFVRLCAGRTAAEAVLPFRALSLSRRVLDEALLARAVECGCEVNRGVGAERLRAEDRMWTATLSDSAQVRARTVFLATGKHDLHGWAREGGNQTDLIGFKLHWRLAPSQVEALRESMELFLFPGGYGGLSLVESESANLCLVVRRAVWRREGGWSAFLAALLRASPCLGQRLQDAQPLWPRPLAISPIPYGYLAGRSRGVWCVGDQAAVIPSFTGDGMSIALHSASLAAQMYLAGCTIEEYNRALRKQLKPAMALATLISRTMVTRAGRSVAAAGSPFFSGILRSIAASTRVPAKNLLAASGAGSPLK
jgi:flavin-dependent dehydrogenase